MAEQDVVISFKALGINTLAQAEKAIKSQRDLVKSLTVGTIEFNRESAKLVQMLDAKNAAMQRLTSSAGRMQQSYFQMGTALRSTQMAATNFSRVLQDMPFGLMAIQNNIEPLLMSLQSLKAEAKAAGQSMTTALVGGLMGPAGLVAGISVAIPLLTSLITYVEKLSERVKKSAEEAYQIKARLGIVSAEDRMSAALAGMGAQEAIAGQSRMPGGRSAGTIIGARARGAEIAEAEAAKWRYWEEYNKALDEWIQQQMDQWKAMNPAEKKEPGSRGDFFEGELYGSIRSIRRGAPGVMPKFRTPQMLPMVNANKMMGPSFKSEISADWTKVTDQLGHTLTDALTRGFMDAFKNGTNLLKSFADSVLSSLMAIAAQQVSIYAISGLLSLIPGIGSFLEIAGRLGGFISGSSGKTPSGGGKGKANTGGAPGFSGGPSEPLYSIPYGGGVVGRLEDINESIQALNLRVDGVDMLMAVERAKLQKRAR